MAIEQKNVTFRVGAENHIYKTSLALQPGEFNFLLGGYTATLKEGRLVEFGRTVLIYRKPSTLESAEVFSDPPINTAAIKKTGRYGNAW
ncbi:MAG: hypothetical protein ABR512_04115 [Desulfopila sp.]